MSGDGNKSFARRDFLHKIESEIQVKWEREKVFEEDAPSEECEKYFVTFPYPYMNGLLHIGHAYSLTKAIFAAQYQRLQGKKVLFPFGFHCTGMPIQAAANKLKREYETYGSPLPTFPPGRPQPVTLPDGTVELSDEGVKLTWKSPPCTGGKKIKQHILLRSVGGGDFHQLLAVPHPSPEVLKEEGNKVSASAAVEGGSCVYKVVVELEDGSRCPEGKASDEVSVDAAPKDKKGAGGPPGKRTAKKILMKTGDAAFQWEILHSMGMSPDELLPFTAPEYWLDYYPPLGKRDLLRFGTGVDFRRSFITTAVNPFYDKFIRWQFNKLKEADKIGFGKRPTIYSETDGQACMDHDRSEGEGVQPQEYTALKIAIVELPPALSALQGKRVYLLAATLRPETMVGQTNCWILPEGVYGCFKADDTQVYICSHRAARNMSFQGIFPSWGKPELLQDVKGQDLMGVKLEAPICQYKVIHLLPLLTIKMDKGTGVVTSVPSDSPDDYAAFMDLLKPAKREHFGIKAEWIEPFPMIPIIDTEIDGEVRSMAAQYMCEKLGVQSQKDSVKLAEAHDVCYKLGFDKGIMSAGPLKGMPVKKAKFDQRAAMINAGEAFLYNEPEKKVVGRSGDECVVASIDQWYLKYGEEAWRKKVEDHMNSDQFSSFNNRILESFMDATAWLKEWACSRSWGLGTRVPWDEQFLIESLSDSTIYMAYYTVAHLLQRGDFNGSEGGPYGIKPEDLTDDVWDFVFLNGPKPTTKVPDEALELMRKEFRFWYPMDLRVSAKDLIQNHLTMCMYNHVSIWEKEPELWPRGVFCNGMLQVNNEKMSKSKGNFYLLKDIMAKHSADTVRLAAANAGDTLEDANFEEGVANSGLLSLYALLDMMRTYVEGSEPLAEGLEDGRFADRWFANEMNRLVVETKGYYDVMMFREALRTSFFEFKGVFDKYRDICRALGGLPNRALTMRYFEWQVIILSPVCPHCCEHGWALLGKPGSVIRSRWPTPTASTDLSTIAQGRYIFKDAVNDLVTSREKASKKEKPTEGVIYVAKSFPEWKVSVLEKMRAKHAEGKLPTVSPDDMKKDKVAKEQWSDLVKEIMADPTLKPFGKFIGPFAGFKRDEVHSLGDSALASSVPFDEMALVSEHAPYLKDKLGLVVTVKFAEEAPSGHEATSKQAQPGQPAVFWVTSGGTKAEGAGKKDKPSQVKEVQNGGGKTEKAAPEKKVQEKQVQEKQAKAEKSCAAPAKGTINDLAKLNELLSDRSYIEGGANPTAADGSQFSATPCAVDANKYPHVDRWYRHIRFFSPLQRAKW